MKPESNPLVCSCPPALPLEHDEHRGAVICSAGRLHLQIGLVRDKVLNLPHPKEARNPDETGVSAFATAMLTPPQPWTAKSLDFTVLNLFEI